MVGRSRNGSVGIVSRVKPHYRDISLLFPAVGRKLSRVTAPRAPLGSSFPRELTGRCMKLQESGGKQGWIVPKMEAARYSGTSVNFYWTTRRHILEDLCFTFIYLYYVKIQIMCRFHPTSLTIGRLDLVVNIYTKWGFKNTECRLYKYSSLNYRFLLSWVHFAKSKVYFHVTPCISMGKGTESVTPPLSLSHTHTQACMHARFTCGTTAPAFYNLQ
jgi:hypothetical protein